MGKFNISFLFLFFILIYSCTNINTQSPSNKSPQINSESAEVSKLFLQYLNKQAQINLIHYNAQRTDTFINGTVRVQTGRVRMKRNPEDSALNLSFSSQSDSAFWSHFYHLNTLYEISEGSVVFKKNADYGEKALNSTGGQLIIKDIFRSDTNLTKFYLEDLTDSTFLCKSNLFQGSIKRTNILIIHKKTLCPKRVSVLEINKQKNLKKSTTWFLKNIRINDQIDHIFDSTIRRFSKMGEVRRQPGSDVDHLIGEKIPEITFTTFKNRTIHIRSLESQVVLLDFWELWCSPCIKSLPEVNKIANTYQSYGLFSLGIATDDIENAIKHIEEKGYTFSQAIGNQEMKSLLNINSYPRYVLINQNGIIHDVYFGFSDAIELDINKLLID